MFKELEEAIERLELMSAGIAERKRPDEQAHREDLEKVVAAAKAHIAAQPVAAAPAEAPAEAADGQAA